MKISISELQKLLLFGLSDFSGKNISSDDDFYWCIFPCDSFDMSKTPDLAVGSLEDDLIHLRTFAENKIPFGPTDIS